MAAFAVAMRSPARRAIAAAVLLLVEGMALTLRFDSALLRGTGPQAWWLGHVSELPRIALAIGTVFLLGAERLRAIVRTLAREEAPASVAPWIAFHGAVLALFVVVTAKLFDGAPEWFLPWLGLALATVASLAPLVLSFGGWRRALGSGGQLLALAALAGLAAWGAGALSSVLARPLQARMTLAVHRFVSLFLSDAFVQPVDFLVGTPRFRVEIAPSCSGYEGMGLVLVFLGVFLWTHRTSLRFPAALVLLPIALVAAALGNVLRIGLLVLVGQISPAVAQGGFHSYAGAVSFSAIALATAWIALRVPMFARVRSGTSSSIAPSASTSTSEYLAPFVVFLAAQMITGLASDGRIDTFYPLRVLAAGAALWAVRTRVRTELRGPSWVGPAVGIAVAIMWLRLAPADGARTTLLTQHAAARSPALVAVWLAFRAVGSIVVAPLVEELAFRGYLMRRLGSRDFEGVELRAVGLGGIAISSALFGAFHPFPVAGALAGCAYALTARQRNRLSDAIVAHATTNAILVAYAVATGNWSAWL